MKVLIR